MSLHHNPRIVTDGLVFAYDMDNVAKSFKGKPTTNLIETNLTSFTKDNGCTVTATGEYFQGSPVYRVVFNSGTLPRIRTNFTYTAQQYSGSIYYKVVVQGSHSPSLYFREINFGTNYASTLLNSTTWAKANINHTFSASGTVMFLLYQANSNSTSDTVIDFAMPQAEVGSFSTPFVNGTRSNTQALLDMSKSKNTITASSLTYNSDGTFEFEGTGGIGAAGDYLSCGNSSDVNFGTGNFTLSFFANRTATGYQGGSYVSKGNGTSLGFDFRDSNFYVHGSSGLISSMSFNPSQNSMNHHTFVFDRSSSPYINYYLNGEYSSSSTTNNSANIGSSIDTTRDLDICRSQAGGVNRYFNGTMPIVKLYNRALTAAEIKQNFNATRGRVGI